MRTPITTAKQALELLRQVVNEAGPAYVDPLSLTTSTCRYQIDGVPCCIVGRSLALAGWSVEQLKAIDSHGGGYGMSAVDMPRYFGEISPEAAAVFEAAQSAQDSGSPWLSALASAEIVAS